MFDNNKISTQQLGTLFILDLFSTSVLSIPRELAEIAKEDAWILLCGGGLLAIVYTIIICKLASLFPKESFFQYTAKIISKPLAYVISLIFLLKILVSAALDLRIFGELVKQLLLPKTPIEIIMISMLLVAAYLVRKGYEARARIAEILLYLVLIPILFVLIFAISQAKLSNLAPMFVTKPTDIIVGSYFASFFFSEMEFGLLIFPFIIQPGKVLKTSVGSVLIVVLLNLFVLITTIGNLGVQGTSDNIWPVMILMQTIQIPGALIERQDALMVLFWFFSVFAIINAFIFFASYLLQQLMNSKKHSFLVLPLLPIIYYISLIPDNIVQTYEYSRALKQYFGISFLLPVPLILFLLAKLRKLGEPNENKTT